MKKWISRLLPSREKSVKGMATWTDGGKTTKCGMPWTYNHGFTASVGEKSPYKCGQVLKIRNLSIAEPVDVLVIVVDEVKGYPPNKVNLHRAAFEALGSPATKGIIEVEITPMS